MQNSNTVTIAMPLQRYEQLIDLETRVDVVVERVAHKGYLSAEDLMWILGTKLSVELAQELREKAENERKEYAEKYGREESEVAE